MKDIKLKGIGEVQAVDSGFAITVKEDYREALTGLEGFSHLHILWWADQVDDEALRKTTVVDKPYKVGPDKLGIFATRSPIRPNPIAMTLIMVTDIDVTKGIIYTPYIDAEPETPVLDIKPFFPCSDVLEQHSVPDWGESFPDSVEASASFDWSTIFNF